MAKKRKRSKRKKNKQHLLLILLLITAGIFLFIAEPGKEDIPDGFFDIFKAPETGDIAKPEFPLTRKLPRVAIVMDDLGNSRALAQKVLNMNGPITLSILPQQKYSAWIAEEGHRRGHEILVHLPMEATKPLKLGAGGIYTWMSDREIIETVRKNISSIPHLKGANNHMGSSFTQDKRAMGPVISELKKRGLFFLDSLTSPDSVGFRLAKAQGIITGRRDIFLDNSDNLRYIETQWNKLMEIAEKRGYAIALGHPKKSTLIFLQKKLQNNTQVTVVPVSELLVD
jgi:polysaccharide deacetylase 2 family uncharacterized protein YibQ